MEPITIGALLTGSWLAYQNCLAAIHEYCELSAAARTRQWLDALRSTNTAKASPSDEATTFWKSDSAGLMHAYHRGVPRLIVRQILGSASGRDTDVAKSVMTMVAETKDASKALAASVTGDPDNQRRHRLQVFPCLPAIQVLPMVDGDLQQELCSGIAKLLRDTQSGASGYTDSACDQINQIVPQILTDQLIAGPHAWRTMFVTDEIISALMAPAQTTEGAQRFETGLGLSIQFLEYYSASLEKRSAVPVWAIGQRERIADYMSTIQRSSALLMRDFIPWIRALESHTAAACLDPQPHRFLIRQSSSAIIANAYRTQDVPPELLQLCLLNNLRAAFRGFGLPDEEDRHNRTRTFLAEHGITRQFATSTVKNCVSEGRSDFRIRALEFADSLPGELTPVSEGPASVSTTQGMTLDELSHSLSELRRKQGLPRKIKEWKLIPQSEGYAGIIARQIVRACRSIHSCTASAKLKKDIDTLAIEDLVKRALANSSSETPS